MITMITCPTHQSLLSRRIQIVRTYEHIPQQIMYVYGDDDDVLYGYEMKIKAFSNESESVGVHVEHKINCNPIKFIAIISVKQSTLFYIYIFCVYFVLTIFFIFLMLVLHIFTNDSFNVVAVGVVTDVIMCIHAINALQQLLAP